MLWAQYYSPDPVRISLPLFRVKGSSETKILYGLLGRQGLLWRRTEEKTRKEKNGERYPINNYLPRKAFRI